MNNEPIQPFMILTGLICGGSMIALPFVAYFSLWS